MRLLGEVNWAEACSSYKDFDTVFRTVPHSNDPARTRRLRGPLDTSTRMQSLVGVHSLSCCVISGAMRIGIPRNTTQLFRWGEEGRAPEKQ